MDVRPFLDVNAGTIVALQTRGADAATVIAQVARWRADGVRLPPVLVPAVDPVAVARVPGLLASTRVPVEQVALEVPERALATPGLRAAVGAGRRQGLPVVLAQVAAAPPGTLGTPTDRVGDVLALAPAVWRSIDPGRVVGLARDLGWDVWAEDVVTAAELAGLAAAGVRAASGDALAPWMAADRLERVLAPAASPAPPPPARPVPARAVPPPAAKAPAARRPRRSHAGWIVLAALGLVLVVALAVHWGFVPLLTDDKVDQPVADGGHGPLARQGFNLTAWGSNTYNSRHARRALNEAAELGANTVAIVVTQYVSDAQATDIHAVKDKTPSDRSLRRVIRIAKQLGFYVSIKPHVDTVSGDWRGDIDPEDFDAFAASYRTFVLHYARLAEDAEAEELIAGTELKGLTARMAQAGNGGEEINDDIRKVFGGTVGYAANWDELDHVPFWDKVDFIGIDAYYPLSTGDGSVDALVDAWQPYKEQALDLAHRYGKPLVFTEAGYQNKEGASETPWGVPSEAPVADQAQVNALQALFTAWHGVPELEGVYLWQLYAGNPADLDPGDWTVIGKPAQDTVGEAFGG